MGAWRGVRRSGSKSWRGKDARFKRLVADQALDNRHLRERSQRRTQTRSQGIAQQSNEFSPPQAVAKPLSGCDPSRRSGAAARCRG
jgi:hypothetical protein